MHYRYIHQVFDTVYVGEQQSVDKHDGQRQSTPVHDEHSEDAIAHLN